MASRLEVNANSGTCYQGQTHGHEGFLLFAREAEEILKKDPSLAAVVHPYLTGDDLLTNPNGRPSRYIIDLSQCEDLFAAAKFKVPFAIVQALVLPEMEKNARAEREKSGAASGPRQNHFRKWWRLWRGREEMLAAVRRIPRYVVCSRVTKRPVFEFVHPSIHPNDAVQVFALADDYSFGVLQSEIHWAWFVARCSTLEARFRYTSDTVFDSFPWPQQASESQARSVCRAAVELREVRRRVMNENGWSYRELYRAAEMAGKNPLKEAQAALDSSVANCFGMRANTDPLAFLLDLNSACAEAERSGRPVVGPGLPAAFRARERFVSSDCIRMLTS